MEQNMIAATPEYISPQELSHRLKSMSILNIVMSKKEEAWLRLVRRLPSEEESYNINNGGGDEMDIFFEENGVFIRGFDHENELSPFAADEWDEGFFSAIYEGVPQNFLDRYEDEEERESVTFCMWYDYEAKCWKQNIVEGNDGGKDYLHLVKPVNALGNFVKALPALRRYLDLNQCRNALAVCFIPVNQGRIAADHGVRLHLRYCRSHFLLRKAKHNG